MNEAARQPHKTRVKNSIDLALLKNPKHTLRSLSATLEKEGIHTAIRRNEEGIVYGVTYVDHRTKCVFNGSDLGKEYSAKGLQERCNKIVEIKPNSLIQQKATNHSTAENSMDEGRQKTSRDQAVAVAFPKIVDDLLHPSSTPDFVPHQLKKAKKKKQKRISTHL
jgi:hypothetical protein